MSNVILSGPVRSNLLSLQNTADLLSNTQNRLATGLKVNSALDDPSAFFTGASLNSRASDLNRLLDSVGLAVQTIEAADAGISAITDLVETAQATARQALQSAGPATPSVAAATTGTVDLGTDVAAATTGSVDVGTDQAAVNAGTGTSFTGGETLQSLGFGNGETITITTDAGTTTHTIVDASTEDVDAVISTLTGNGNATVINNGGVVQATGGDNVTSITFGGTGDVSQLGLTTTTVEPSNTVIGALTGTATITVGTNATLTLDFDSAITNRAQLETALGTLAGGTAVVDGSGNVAINAGNNTDSIVLGGTADTGLGLADDATIAPTNATIAALTGTATITVGTNTTLTLDFDSSITNRAQLETALATLSGGTAAIDGSNNLTITAGNTTDSIVVGGTADTGLGLGDDATIAPTTGTAVNNATRAALESEFNALLTQIDQLAGDASFNGNNLLQSDNLTVIFNEDGTSSLTISGVDFDSGGLGVNAAATDAFQTDSNINTTLTELDTAISTLRTQASTFGSNLSAVEVRQDFTKELVNILETGAAGLTLADTNVEGANLLSLQTRQQLSTVSLSLATQSQQNVLRLF